MKVAIYSGTIPSTTFIENLINSVVANGTRVYLFGTRKARVKYKFDNVFQYTTPSSSLKRFFFVLIQFTWAMISNPKRLIKFYKHSNRYLSLREKINYLSRTLPVINHLPDIFHVQWAKSASDWLFLKELFGVKLILSLRGAHINYSPLCDPELAVTYRNTFPKYDSFHAVSISIAKEAQKYGADASKIKVIYSGVDLEKIEKINEEVSFYNQTHKSANRHRLNKSTDKQLNIISVGRFHWKKGYTYALDACKILKDREVDFKYTIVAMGDNQEYLYQIEDLGLNEDVEIKPGLPHEATLRQIASSDVLLLPSIEEGIANVVLEAMALGTFVISTNCGGLREVVKNNRSGYLINAMSSEEIANAINQFLHIDQNERQAMIEAAEQIAENSFNITRTGLLIKELYEELR